MGRYRALQHLCGEVVDGYELDYHHLELRLGYRDLVDSNGQ